MAICTDLSPALVRDGGNKVEVLTVDINIIKKLRFYVHQPMAPRKRTH